MQIATIYANIGNMGDDESLLDEIAAHYKTILGQKIRDHFAEYGWSAEIVLENAAGAVRAPELHFNDAEEKREFEQALPQLQDEAFQEACELVQ